MLVCISIATSMIINILYNIVIINITIIIIIIVLLVQ